MPITVPEISALPPHDDASLPIAAPYEQQPGEAVNHFAWFHCYLMMGPGRSLLGACNFFYQQDRIGQNRTERRPYLSPPGAWRKAFEKWNWSGRVRVWDQKERERRLKIVREKEKVVLDRVFVNAERLLDRCEQADKFAAAAFKFPLTRQHILEGTTIIEPADWNMNTAIRALMAAGASNRLALHLVQQIGFLERASALREFAGEGNGEGMVLEARAVLESQGFLVTAPVGAQEPPTARQRENQVLSQMELLIAHQVTQGDKGALSLGIRIAQRRARLNGLDKPFDPRDEEAPKKRRRMEDYDDIHLAILEEILDQYEDEDASP